MGSAGCQQVMSRVWVSMGTVGVPVGPQCGSCGAVTLLDMGPCRRCHGWVLQKSKGMGTAVSPISVGFWMMPTPQHPTGLLPCRCTKPPFHLFFYFFFLFYLFFCTHRSNLLENAPKVWAIYQLQDPIKLFFFFFFPLCKHDKSLIFDWLLWIMGALTSFL